MSATHDPRTTLRQLRQILGAGKLPIGFFLGAGCPTSIITADEQGHEAPLIPTIAGLTTQVVNQLQTDATVGGAMKKLSAILDEDKEQTATIERLLTRARSLREVAGQGQVRGLNYLELDGLDKAICKAISERVRKDLPDCSPYHSLARFSGFNREFPVSIFTTNYDLLMEQAFEQLRIPFFDGFIGARYPFFDQRAVEGDAIPSRWVRYWKLHGSIDWRFKKAENCVFRSSETTLGEEQMIHPSHLKYEASRRMPYLVMIDRLRTFLRDTSGPAAIFVCGYSFGDQHVNEALIEGLQANSNAACFALLFGKLENYAAAIEVAQNVSNLTLIADDQAMIRRTAGNWLLQGNADPNSLGTAFSTVSASSVAEDAPKPCLSALGDFRNFATFLTEMMTVASE